MVRAVEIENVNAPIQTLDRHETTSVQVAFTLSEPADVALVIYDGRNIEVSRVESKRRLPSGDHSLEWDGTDQRGRPVPPEAYLFTLEARGVDGATARWDLSDRTGAERIQVEDLKWDPDRGVVSYRLAKTCRIRLRLGLADQGPLLNTLLDWVPRSSGLHELRWDGRDQSGLLDLARDPRLRLGAEAFSLSTNSFLVLPERASVAWIEDLDPKVRRPRTGSSRKRMFDYAQQDLEKRRDFRVRMEVRGARAKNTAGFPIVNGPVPVRIDLDDAERERMLSERFEAVYFVDGEFQFENEVGFLPVTWRFDPRGMPPGVHYLTANLRGYEGHFGIATIAVEVERPAPGVGEGAPSAPIRGSADATP